MKAVMLALFGLFTFSNLLALLFGDDLDCECLEDLDV